MGHLSFFQVNRFLLPDLVGSVLGDTKGGLALDLFAGVGLFTLPLAHRFARVIGVESNAAAARDLATNLQESGASSPAFRENDVEAFLARWTETPDLVVLDPPRAGVPAAALSRLANLAPHNDRLSFVRSGYPRARPRHTRRITGKTRPLPHQ